MATLLPVLFTQEEHHMAQDIVAQFTIPGSPALMISETAAHGKMPLTWTFEDMVTPRFSAWIESKQPKRAIQERPSADQFAKKQNITTSIPKAHKKLAKRITHPAKPSSRRKETYQASKPPTWEINLSLSSLATEFDPTFTTEYFEVKPSTKGGMGAFALNDIKKGTIIMLEAPLFKGDIDTLVPAYHEFTVEQSLEYLSLHAWPGSSRGYHQRITCIFATNRFQTTEHSDGIFLKSSRFNHACHPYSTCTYEYDPETDKLKTTALMDIVKGQEITISYSSQPETLYENYGFHCDCPGCPPYHGPHPEISELTNKDPFYF